MLTGELGTQGNLTAQCPFPLANPPTISYALVIQSRLALHPGSVGHRVPFYEVVVAPLRCPTGRKAPSRLHPLPQNIALISLLDDAVDILGQQQPLVPQP